MDSVFLRPKNMQGGLLVGNGQKMLNVHFARPLHHNNQLSLLKSESSESLVHHSVNSQSSEITSVDVDEDEEEFKKEMIWNYGPTPSPSFNFAAYANDSVVIKKLVDLGVNMSLVERKYGTMPFILKLDYDKDILPRVRFLTENGVSEDIIGWYLSRNPFILQEDIENMEKRLDYLTAKGFQLDGIQRILNFNPFWLSFSVPRIDRRLGFFQEYFHLKGQQVRELAVRGPKLITSNLGRVKDMTFTVKEEMGFSPEEIVQLLLDRPRIWREKPDNIRRRFDYLHNTVKFPHEAFILCPELLLVRQPKMRQRIGFLEHVGRAQFDPEKPNYVSFKMIFEGDDSKFATSVAKSSAFEFNEFLKTL